MNITPENFLQVPSHKQWAKIKLIIQKKTHLTFFGIKVLGSSSITALRTAALPIVLGEAVSRPSQDNLFWRYLGLPAKGPLSAQK